MRRFLAVTLVFSMVAVSGTASGGIVRHDRSLRDHKSIMQARSYDEPVGKIFIDGGRSTGSGTLIGDRFMLTAGHVTAGASSIRVRLKGSDYSAVRSVVHPGWRGNNLFDGVDLSIIELDRPVAGVAPAKLYRGRAESERNVAAVGFGLTGNGIIGTNFGTKTKKRWTQNVANVYNENLLVTDFDDPRTMAGNVFGSPSPRKYEGLTTFGDSGGGLFMKDGGRWTLAGVTSFIWNTSRGPWGNYGDSAGFTRVSSHLGWIDAGLRSHFIGSSYAPTSHVGGDFRLATLTVPEPSSAVIGFAMAAMSMLSRRWR